MVTVKLRLTEQAKKSLNADVMKSNRVRFTFRKWLERIVNFARDNHFYKTRTGVLERNTIAKLISDVPLKGSVEIDDNVCPYGKFVHEGTQPHWIKPVNKMALRFASTGHNPNWINLSGFAFSKGHEVRGIKPDPFVHDAIVLANPQFSKELSEIIELELEGK